MAGRQGEFSQPGQEGRPGGTTAWSSLAGVRSGHFSRVTGEVHSENILGCSGVVCSM